MSKESLTLRELIELIDTSVWSKKIEQDYPYFLKSCRELGISSYILNTIIIRAKESCNNKDEGGVDYSFFIPYELTRQQNQDRNTIPLNNDKVLFNEIYKLKLKIKKKRIVCFLIIFFFLLLSCIGIYIFYNHLYDTKQSLYKANQEIRRLNDTIQIQYAIIATKDYKIEREQSNIRKLNDSITHYKTEVYSAKEQIAEKTADIERTNSQSVQKNNELIEITQKYKNIIQNPFVITEIKIRNEGIHTVISDYGQPIYSKSTRFLCFKIYIRPFLDAVGKEYTLNVKLFRNDILESSSSSSYTFSPKIRIEQSNNTYDNGWGDDKDGRWPSGTYRYEFWYKGTCLGKKTFSVL